MAKTALTTDISFIILTVLLLFYLNNNRKPRWLPGLVNRVNLLKTLFSGFCASARSLPTRSRRLGLRSFPETFVFAMWIDFLSASTVAVALTWVTSPGEAFSLEWNLHRERDLRDTLRLILFPDFVAFYLSYFHRVNASLAKFASFFIVILPNSILFFVCLAFCVFRPTWSDSMVFNLVNYYQFCG